MAQKNPLQGSLRAVTLEDTEDIESFQNLITANQCND